MPFMGCNPLKWPFPEGWARIPGQDFYSLPFLPRKEALFSPSGRALAFVTQDLGLSSLAFGLSNLESAYRRERFQVSEKILPERLENYLLPQRAARAGPGTPRGFSA